MLRDAFLLADPANAASLMADEVKSTKSPALTLVEGDAVAPKSPVGAVILADAGAVGGRGPEAIERVRREAAKLPVVFVEDGMPLDGSAPEVPDSIRRAIGHPGSAGDGPHATVPPDDGVTTYERGLRPLRVSHERLVHELTIAEQVQRSMLPRHLPRAAGIAFGAAYQPYLHLAGDFYNAFRLDSDHVGFYVGDVMGHGPAAALLSVYAMRVIQTKRIEVNSYQILAPSTSLGGLNRAMIEEAFPGEPFVTMIYGVLDVANLRLKYCSAGHPPAWRLRQGEPVVQLGGGGPLLGVVEADFETHEVDLLPGDRVVFYSDGIDSVRWGDAGQGAEGLIARLSVRDGSSPQELIDEAMASAQQDDWRPDDLTLMMLELTM